MYVRSAEEALGGKRGRCCRLRENVQNLQMVIIPGRKRVKKLIFSINFVAMQLDSNVFDDGWLKHDANGDDKSARVKRLISLSKQCLKNGDIEGAMDYQSQVFKLNQEILVGTKEEIDRLLLEMEQK